MHALTEEDRQRLQTAHATIWSALDRLRNIEPVLLDLSIREPVTGSPLGHTLEDKKALFTLTGELGLRDRVIGTLTAQETVDDLFLIWLHAQETELNGCFTFAAPGTISAGAFKPDASMIKQAEIGAPNVIFHTEISQTRRARSGQSQEQVLDALRLSVAWIRERSVRDTATSGQVYVNLSDLMDCFMEEPDYACSVVKCAAALAVDGLMFEDPRGTFFPFQHAALVRWLRAYLPPPVRILVHPHAGNGMEHASVIEAVLAGADGAWLGFTTHAATTGHASGLAYLTNLMRANNPQVEENYTTADFVPAARTMAKIHTGGEISPTEPVAGGWAYRDVLANFSQTTGLFGDVDPKRVGAEHGWRIVPAIASPGAIAARLDETGIAPGASATDPAVAEIAERMRLSLLNGEKISGDDRAVLARLYREAS